MRNIYMEKMERDAGREEERRTIWKLFVLFVEAGFMIALIFAIVAFFDVISSYSATPYIDGRTGEWVYAEDGSQDNAIDISDPPPISNVSKTLDALDALEEVYVPDSDDDCPVSDAVPLAVDVQEYIWTHCKRTTEDYENYYCFILGAIQRESTFRTKVSHTNDNGTIDRGLMQINSCNIGTMKRAGLITCTDDLFNVQKNIDCGFHLMDQYIAKFGVTEAAYYAYNTGNEWRGSNRNSRLVMQYMAEWRQKLFR